MGDNKIHVLVVGDHPSVNNGTQALLNKFDDIQVVGAAKTGPDAIELNKDLKPDVLLIDLNKPGLDGVEVIRLITAEQPDAKILLLTNSLSDGKPNPAIISGVLGYLRRDSEPEELEKAIRHVYRGEQSLNHGIDSTMLDDQEPSSPDKPITEALTIREHEVLHLLAQGAGNRQIAQKLVISEVTVRTHISRIMSKLNLTNRVQAALYALREGWVGLHDGDNDPV